MFNNKLLTLIMGYILGNFAAYLYGNGKKKPKKLKDEKDLQAMFDAFLETQKNIAEDVEEKFMDFNPKKRVGKAKKEMVDTLRKYLAQGQQVFEDIKNDIQKELQASNEQKQAKNPKS